MSDRTPVTRDVLVVVPGIMGSELVDADGHPVWSLGVGSLVQAIRTLGRSLHSLKLPEGIGDGAPGDGVQAVALMPGLHVIPGVWSPVRGYSSLMKFLCGEHLGLSVNGSGDPDQPANLMTFPYDWRLSNRYNGKLLAKVAGDALARWRSQPGMGDAKLILVCHSMGGLVARWFLECEDGAELTRCLVTIGTPHRGAVKSLEKLVNGVQAGIGPLRFRLDDLVQSMPSMYQLLPTYSCITKGDRQRVKLADLHVSGLNSSMVADAAEFHAAIAGDPTHAPYQMHKVVGIRQPTPTTARLVGDGVSVSDTIDGLDQGGDGTVSRLSAEPALGRGVDVHEVADQHGELHGTRSVLDLVDGIVSREDLIWEGASSEAFGVSMAELWSPDAPPKLFVPDLGDRRLRVTVFDEEHREIGIPAVVRPDGVAVLDRLPPGGYEARVDSPVPGGPPAVTSPFLVWDASVEAEAPTQASDLR